MPLPTFKKLFTFQPKAPTPSPAWKGSLPKAIKVVENLEGASKGEPWHVTLPNGNRPSLYRSYAECSAAILFMLQQLIEKSSSNKLTSKLTTACTYALDFLDKTQSDCATGIVPIVAKFADIRAYLFRGSVSTANYSTLLKKALLEARFAHYVLAGPQELGMSRWTGDLYKRMPPPFRYRGAPQTNRIMWFMITYIEKIKGASDSKSLLELLDDLPILHYLTPEQNDFLYATVAVNIWTLAESLFDSLPNSGFTLPGGGTSRGQEYVNDILTLLGQLNTAWHRMESRIQNEKLTDWSNIEWSSYMALWAPFTCKLTTRPNEGFSDEQKKIRNVNQKVMIAYTSNLDRLRRAHQFQLDDLAHWENDPNYMAKLLAAGFD